MRTHALLFAAGCVGFAMLTGLRGDVEADEKPDPITALVRQLGDDRYSRREEAMRLLERLGEKALPALVKAGATSEDLEIRRRATRLIRVLMPEGYKSKATGLTMVRIINGDFLMGSPYRETGRRADESPHQVHIRWPFFLGSHEVTQGEYRQVMKANPSWFATTGPGKDKIDNTDTTRYPVERVSWFDAVEFCNRLSRLDGFPAYYRLSTVKREGDSIISATVTLLGGKGYRLPTGAEWEYACRAGSTTAFHFGTAARAGDLNAKSMVVASGYGSAAKWRDVGRTTRVGSYPANRWGLYDMHGNVGEWCGDWYDKDYYASSPTADPKGPATGHHRVVRGGSWLVTEGSCRSASRFWHVPGENNYQAGFRVARDP